MLYLLWMILNFIVWLGMLRNLSEPETKLSYKNTYKYLLHSF